MIMQKQAALDNALLATHPWEDPRISAGLGWVSLFASTGTWICCALPILLVTLGAGAILAGIMSRFPFLVVLGEQKNWMFAVSGLLLAAAAVMTWRTGRRCPADPVLVLRCQRVQRWNKRIVWISVIVWVIGFISAYVALPLRMLLDL